MHSYKTNSALNKQTEVIIELRGMKVIIMKVDDLAENFTRLRERNYFVPIKMLRK